MEKHEKADLIRESGIVAIMRAQSSEQLIAAADAIKAGGVRVIEVTMTTPGALSVIETASKKYGSEVLLAREVFWTPKPLDRLYWLGRTSLLLPRLVWKQSPCAAVTVFQ